MDVLNMLRSKASWGFRSGRCEMQELQELHGVPGLKQTVVPEDSSLSDASTLVSYGASVERERSPLADCVPNHPRFGAMHLQSNDDASMMSADVESLSNCSSGQKGPRAAPSELGGDKEAENGERGRRAKDEREQEENGFADPSQQEWSDGLSDDASDDAFKEEEPLKLPVLDESPNGLFSLRIATNLLPKDMHAPTTTSVHDVTHETPLAGIKAEPSCGGHSDEEHEVADTAFSPPLAQAIDRNDAFVEPAAYPRILSMLSTGTPAQEERQEEAHGDGVVRTIRAAQSDNEHQVDTDMRVRVGSAADHSGMSPEIRGVESSPQATLRRERLRKQKEAAEKVQQEMQEMQALMEALLAQNPALVHSELAAPLEPSELERLRARCSQQEEELSAFRGKLEDIQALCGAAQDRCASLEQENQQMQTQVATLKWQLNLQEEFRFLTPPPHLSCEERELWRRKLLQDRLLPPPDKATVTARKLALDEPQGVHSDPASRPPRSVTPDASAAYLAAVADARRNPTPEKLAFAAKARGDLGWLLGGRTAKAQGGPFVGGGSEGDLEGFSKVHTRSSSPDCEAQSPRSLIRNLSASAEYAMREPNVRAPVSVDEPGVEESVRGLRASLHTPLARDAATLGTPVAQSPLLSLESPLE
ncbi:hypothetical protein KFL_002340120 [Klebsormidium nitens]|uniref:Uncharacterized protein n=1 Tax=Klebsormidium nitens TaxID=105231 RepID=A0A1Y1I642_KLENI|nr:hypothetical protein KFL_002340120 [Klebsormidium nitens]|eukprot:GAQ85422.1 hypothetical protein KFL_002340120 [Klebsormidium nitens]